MFYFELRTRNRIYSGGKKNFTIRKKNIMSVGGLSFSLITMPKVEGLT